MSKAVLELRNIQKKFSSAGHILFILKQINLIIERGETIAVTGPSGSGKSTLLGLMAGLDRPSGGQIFFEEEAIENWDEDALSMWRRLAVGFIFQNFRLVKILTALENVILPLEILGHNIVEAKNKAMELLTQLGIDQRATHFPHQLSGGEQQRVAIARAYVHEPQIIFADEPTGSLDSHTAEKVLQSLLHINRQRKTSLIIVTHDQKVAEQMNRRCRLSEGMVVEA